jgi:membrane dipeptidase
LTKTLARDTRGAALTAQFAELIQRGWTQNELGNLAGGNLLRVMAEMESISHRMRKDGRKPSMAKYDKRRDLDPHEMPF